MVGTGAYPGGQRSGRPPSTCRCRWSTDWPAAAPTLVTTRKPPATPSCRATWLTAPTRLASSPAWRSETASRLGTWSRGTTRTWVGACGLTSRNATTSSVSSTTSAAISPLAIRQNRQAGSYVNGRHLLELTFHAFAVGAQASHSHHLVGQRGAAREAHLDVVVAGALGKALAGALDQDLEAPAHVGLVEAAAQLVAEGDQLPGARLLLGLGHLLRHVRGGGAWSLRVAEHVQLGEADPLGHAQGGAELRGGLAREADDDIGGQPEAGDLGLGVLHPLQELGDPVRAVHALQHLVVAGLEGDVQVAADLRVVAHPLHQGGGDLDREHAGDAQPQQAVDGGEALHQPGQAVPFAFVLAVLAEVHAGQHDLAYAPVDLAAHVGHQLVGRVGPQRAAGARDDAEGAPLVAAGLRLDRHPGPQPLGRRGADRQGQAPHGGDAGDQFGDAVLVVVVDHQVDAGEGRARRAVRAAPPASGRGPPPARGRPRAGW